MNESSENPVPHKKIMFCAVSMAYNFCTLQGEVVLGQHCCGDMGSCVNLFQSIDPRVREIRVYKQTTGDKKEFALFRKDDDGEWAPIT